MIVDNEPRSVKPRCHNRPAFEPGRMHYAVKPETGFVAGEYLSNQWMSRGCKTWDGVGIGPPSERFPSGTPYPIAHGFDCRGCMHLPEEAKELA